MVSVISLRRLQRLLGKSRTTTKLIIKMMIRHRIMMMQQPTQKSVARLPRRMKRTMMTMMRRVMARLIKRRTRLAMEAITKATGGRTPKLQEVSCRAAPPTVSIQFNQSSQQPPRLLPYLMFRLLICLLRTTRKTQVCKVTIARIALQHCRNKMSTRAKEKRSNSNRSCNS